MTRRFFYTDPLAAAWMATHFGMDIRLEDPEGQGFLEATLILGLREWRDAIAACADLKFFIHPDSLHLLEPGAGDLFRFGTHGPIFKCIPDLDDRGAKLGNIPTPPQWEVSCAREKNGGRIRVLQRNGIPFMWPESEDA